jgi:hypothetical protein
MAREVFRARALAPEQQAIETESFCLAIGRPSLAVLAVVGITAS